MVQVTIEIKGKSASRRVRVTAPSVERALEMAGAGKPGRRVRVVFCKDTTPVRTHTLAKAPPPVLERAA